MRPPLGLEQRRSLPSCREAAHGCQTPAVDADPRTHAAARCVQAEPSSTLCVSKWGWRGPVCTGHAACTELLSPTTHPRGGAAVGSPARASLRNASGAQDQERAERTVLSAAEHTLPEEECDVICYSPPQGSITHAGPLAQGRQHLGSEEQKPGDAAGCVTLPRSGYTSVRRHRWLPVCVPSLRAGASLRWELPGDPLSCPSHVLITARQQSSAPAGPSQSLTGRRQLPPAVHVHTQPAAARDSPGPADGGQVHRGSHTGDAKRTQEDSCPPKPSLAGGWPAT